VAISCVLGRESHPWVRDCFAEFILSIVEGLAMTNAGLTFTTNSIRNFFRGLVVGRIEFLDGFDILYENEAQRRS
jgi:hypothetical protein